MPRLWIDTTISMSVSVGNLNFADLMASFSDVTTRLAQVILIRTIVGIDIARTTHDSGEGSEQVAVGLGVSTQDAFDQGISALPDPALDAEFPIRGWIWRSIYRIFGFAADQPAVYSARVDFDLRSMRKLENGRPFLIAHNTNVEGTSSAIRIDGLIRQLWLVR